MQPLFLAHCFQTHKDHSDPKSTPKKSSLHRLNWTSLCAVDVFLIAEKAGGLLVKPQASRLSGGAGPPTYCGPPETLLYAGISLSGVRPSEIRFMFERKPVNS